MPLHLLEFAKIISNKCYVHKSLAVYLFIISETVIFKSSINDVVKIAQVYF